MSDAAARYRLQLRDAARVAHDADTRDASDLADALYERWYAPARQVLGEQLTPQAVARHLRASDAAGARFEGGWTVLDSDEAHALLGPPRSSWQIPATRDGELRWVDPADLLFEGRVGLRPSVDTLVAVSARRDSLAPFGWWTTCTDAWRSAAAPLVRLYWSVIPEELFRLVGVLTGGLGAGMPWALKCPLQLHRCRRPDAVVLYLPIEAWPRLRSDAVAVHRASRGMLASDVPALTLELATGLALAEDPGGNEASFGSARCEVLGECFAAALAGGRPNVDALAAAAEKALAAHGVSLDAPYLSRGSQMEYRWPTF